MEKQYKKGNLTVVWKPDQCIHAGECVKRLPKVYKPKEKPWVQLENATEDALIKQINACPSGALSYFLNEEKIIEKVSSETKVKVMKNGPLVINGRFSMIATDGTEVSKEKSTAFCRCGASGNKPYCDGKHKQIDFIG